uniref:Leucine-rich repeat-containing protein 43-like n=1 Tax=Phallusia mammillata TaxID=59560 RepID=A0A6F9DK50_9ASCI|nr:leucine-rich repeat-containing protein 43-like [Phallusia mammillata]
MPHSISCYEAFQELLRQLCLKEFPCGFGTWRNPKNQFAEGQYSVTMKDYGVQYEKMEVLQEYLNSGTWDVDTSWSPEAANLRSVAVSQPWKLDGVKGMKFTHEFFKNLRIIDQQVNNIDKNMLKLSNLENLTLSVNLLKDVSSDYLPAHLKVLELCTNCLSSIASLCKNPPPLLHLGLSHNQLYSTDEYKFFSVEYWPSLMSLDLSYNNLTGLVELVDRLASLPNLKNLVLQGNPLALIPGYRGHVVDALRELSIFDDITVSADEKHHFKGLGKKKELILDEAQLVVTIDNLNGIPMPEEMKEDDDRPEFPVISSQFVVQYEMLKDFVPKTCETRDLTTRGGNPSLPVSKESIRLVPTEVVFHETLPKEWEESEILIGHKKLHLVDDLTSLRDFLLNGICFKVLVKKTLSWPVTPTDETPDVPETPAKKSAKDGKETPGKKDAKGKDKGGKADKGKKKNGPRESDAQLRSDPPTFTEFGSQVVPLIMFLEGDHKVDVMCHCGGGPMPTAEELKQTNTEALEESPKPDTKPSRGKSGKRRTPSPDRGKSRGKPGSAGKKKDSKKTDHVAEDDNAENKPPPPITVQVQVELHKWNTASDALKQLDF